jgi:beta-mannosidase
MARVRAVDGSTETPIEAGWECAPLPPGSAKSPAALGGDAKWYPARVPGTAASALALAPAMAWSYDRPRDFDADDWWFRCRVKVPAPRSPVTVLRFGGLATLADVWVDGEPVLRSDNMFREHEVDVGGRLRDGSEIAIRFASLHEELKKKRPRPRWRAQIVAQQQLRWLRTALLGRVPSWTPPVAPVGPYRPVWIESRAHLGRVSADVEARTEGGDGFVDAVLRVTTVDGSRVLGMALVVGPVRTELVIEVAPDGSVVGRGTLTMREAALWWPFTHGPSPLYEVHAVVRTDRGEVGVDLGRTGFRTVDVDRSDGSFGVRVNGVPLFCRGASWTPIDAVGFSADGAAYRKMLDAVRAAGMNMLRLGGTMLYERAVFHDLCDELGILVWQDFMFANMDYPFADDTFVESVLAEATQLVDRVQLSPSLAMLCGNTEVAQQAAMLGLPEKDWSSPLFSELLPAVARAARPDVPYVETTPHGGALPFHVDKGVAHYYGVGAYRRPLEDARRSRVQFAAECLGFANVPCDETIDELMGDGEFPTAHARWKARVPRDRGVAWDFDDVRDHYMRRLFGVDPVALRSTDIPRYLELARVTSGEMMHATIGEWRRAGSDCRGALVWLLRDFWPGAGWGVIDAHGRPKAAYYFLKRAQSPVALFATDEGLNGLSLHAVNDGVAPLEAELDVVMYRVGDIVVAQGKRAVVVPARGVVEVPVDSILGRFVDATYAYRFGPPGHDLVVATLRESKHGDRVGQAFFFPTGQPIQRYSDLGVEAFAEATASGEWRVSIRTKKFAQSLAIDARGFIADDDFFHIEPGGERVVTLRGKGATLSARVLPLNATIPTRVIIPAKP